MTLFLSDCGMSDVDTSKHNCTFPVVQIAMYFQTAGLEQERVLPQIKKKASAEAKPLPIKRARWVKKNKNK